MPLDPIYDSGVLLTWLLVLFGRGGEQRWTTDIGLRGATPETDRLPTTHTYGSSPEDIPNGVNLAGSKRSGTILSGSATTEDGGTGCPMRPGFRGLNERGMP